jgi:ERCC4-related helicase
MKVRVLPHDGRTVFVHGKAGVIEFRDGGSTAFAGSMNETASGLRHAYEIVWEDDDSDAATWVREEFEYFWNHPSAINLPEAVVKHVGAVAKRTEYRSIEEARAAEGGLIAPAAILADRPVYKGGQILRSWQKRFVQTCVEDWKLYKKARFLIADDVGLGKTLSMAAAAIVLSMLDDKPVLVLAPATLTWQWQDELWDMLGLPSAVWSSTQKQWIDHQGFALTAKGDRDQVARCPMRIGIVSTGLIINGDDEGERGKLAEMSFGVLILDEAHKARAVRRGEALEPEDYNKLMRFMLKAAATSDSVLIGTATPIQLSALELWDLVNLIGQGAGQVLGLSPSAWAHPNCIEYLAGRRSWPTEPDGRWELLKNPLPPAVEHGVFRELRSALRISPNEIRGPRFESLSPSLRSTISRTFPELVERSNPIFRRVVRRSRKMLEDRGLLKRVRVAVHPSPDDALPHDLFTGQGLAMGFAFEQAYTKALEFCEAYAQARPMAGFMKTILLRRIGSSVQAGLNTATSLLESAEPTRFEGDNSDDLFRENTAKIALTAEEKSLLQQVRTNLEAVQQRADSDPKISLIVHYLEEMGWLETHGSIIFSQYFDTAEWVARTLATTFPGEPIGLYAGRGNSYLIRDAERVFTERETLKAKVKTGELRLLVATDAACEGLNLQRLGSQVNVDLPWNPARLEQRKGRIQRIGQLRDTIHVINMRYAGTVEDDVYSALSARFSDIFAVLGQLPDSFEDTWVDAVLRDREAVRYFPQRVDLISSPMEKRYWNDVADDTGLDWEFAEKVLSSRDIESYMRQPWR